VIKFPSIEQFRHVIKGVSLRTHYDGTDENGDARYKPRGVPQPVIRYRGTVKLHGTNAALVLEDKKIKYQSRERELTREDDNAGFCNYFSDRVDIVFTLMANILTTLGADSLPETKLAVFGEWCGTGINGGKAAISKLDKLFVIFAVKLDDEWIDIDRVKNLEFPEHRIFNSLRFPSWLIDIDFNEPFIAQDKLGKLTLEVEQECPVSKYFGIDNGVGEGIVWSPVDDQQWNSSQFWFKVKGEKHSATKVRTLAAVDVEALKAVNDFVDATCTESRLEQGLSNLINEQKKPFETTSLGDFIRWVHNDIVKEESDTIAASGFDVKKLGSPISNKARQWFFARLNSET
jgi:hypothetical protein